MNEQLSFEFKSAHHIAYGFAEDVYKAARAIIDFRGDDALIYVALRQFDDFQDEIDQAYWVEVRRACKVILGEWHYWSGGYSRLPMK